MKELLRARKSFLRGEPLRHNPGDDDRTQDKFANVPHGGPQKEGRLPGERISDQQRDEVLSGVLNSEVKMLVLAGMVLDPEVYTAGDLDSMIRDMQRGQKGWNLSSNIAFGYCLNSFDGIGLVAKSEPVNDRTTLGFKATQRGKDTLPVIGHLLDFSLKHPDIALRRVFSTTASPSKATAEGEQAGDYKVRAPKRRFRILKALVENEGPLRESDMRKLVNNSSVELHLESLHNIGLITYENTRVGADHITYTVIPDAISDVHALPSIPTSTDNQLQLRAAYITSKLSGEISPKDVYERLVALFPQYKERDPRGTEKVINRKLHHMSMHGFIEKGKRTIDRKTDISVTEEQRETIAEIVGIIDAFQAGDPTFLAEGEQKARRIIQNPEAAATLMRKAQESSHTALALGQAELKRRLVTFAEQSEGPITSVLAAEYLEHRVGKSYAGAILRELAREGKIQVESRGQVIRYGPVAPQEQEIPLPEDKRGLEQVAVTVNAEIKPFADGIKLLLAAYASHTDPQSESALEVMDQIRSVRALPEYAHLISKRDQIEQRLAVIASEEAGIELANEEPVVETEVEMQENTEVVLKPQNSPKSKTVELRERIQAFKDLGVSDSSEIAQWMGVSRSTITRHIRQMQAQETQEEPILPAVEDQPLSALDAGIDWSGDDDPDPGLQRTL